MNGAGVLPSQLYQLSIAFANLRKEERETTKQPLDTDKLTAEETMAMIADAFDAEELEKIIEMKRGDNDEEIGSEGRE